MGAFHGIISYPLLLRGPRKARAPIYIYILQCSKSRSIYIYIYKIRIYVRYQQTDCNLWWRNLRAVQKSKFPCISKRITMSISNETATTTNSHQISLVNITVVSNLLSMCARSEKMPRPQFSGNYMGETLLANLALALLLFGVMTKMTYPTVTRTKRNLQKL